MGTAVGDEAAAGGSEAAAGGNEEAAAANEAGAAGNEAAAGGTGWPDGAALREVRSEFRSEVRSEGSAGTLREVWSGRAVVVSMATLFAEAVCAGVGLVLYGFTQEGPIGSPILVIFLPFVLALGAIPGFVVTAAVVLPALTLARWAVGWSGRPGRPKWWWTVAATPFAAAAATAVCGVFLALRTGSVGPFAAYAACWAVLTAAAVPAALLAALAARGTGTLRTVRIAATVAGGALLAAFAAGALGVAALLTGLLPAYEPPRLDRADLVGVWEDGSGGTLVLRSDGVARAARVGEPGERCGGVGSWEPERFMGEGRVLVSGDCGGEWLIGGTEERPTLYYFLGDPDDWKRYVLTRRDRGASAR
ncbi:hypothetical protein ACWD6P_11300 [Streptomyces sp. NPDC002446]